ncbi:MAG: alkaline phosphatase, partial [Gemmatimonadetes bacterium]|nr:alkaline phosphatase [Gemmatimonadota bacterium]NIQ52127.1 alkaline phosphatase [Gemmatimonadota bacterium]NIU72238.1 alkaline phosphatase [Gammaproteobacteria bacterium]NIX42757.1 alkaline phosphatase [Gemmatimonadota bacterium]NIY06915.1 alkaline phosphatase [Gemmatimonadota bacterium]
MKRLTILLLLAAAACGPSTRAPTTPAVDQGPFSVILFIGDGTGLTYWSAAKLASSELAIERFPVVGLVDTEASNSRITDSAAGATAYAAGVRTYNGAIGVDPDTAAVRTVLELARSQSMATGLVATATVTHATPAAFAAHVPSRNMHWEIAAQLADAELDVLLGGGRRFFDGAERPDSVDLIERMARRATVVESPDALAALDPGAVTALVGLFAAENPGAATERRPTLPQLTDAAIRVLERDPDGFFLMVEGSQIDWRGHDNAPLQEVVAEVQDFDMAIRQGLMFLQRRPNTLVLVVADHSTGGLALHPDERGVFGAHYTTEGHTAEMVPMFAIGPGAAAFAGIMDNDRVGRLLLQLVREGG